MQKTAQSNHVALSNFIRVNLLLYVIPLLCSCLFSVNVFAQDILQKKIKLNLSAASITEALAEVQKQGDIRFIYDNDIKKYAKIRLNENHASISLKVAIESILKGTNLIYTQTNSYVTIREKQITSQQRSQQKSNISGRVSEKGSLNPLSGVTLRIVETGKSTASDTEGRYRFRDIPAGRYTIEAAYIGLSTQKLQVAVTPEKETVYDIEMESGSSQSLDEVVVVGYGTQSKSHVTGAISQLKATDLKDQAVLNYDQAIIGKVAGVQVIQTTGQPGRGMNFRVRGTGTITSGSEPLIVLDGVPLDRQSQALEMVNTNDIESVEVLKDASAAAIYGSRGANGVVMITTKSGKSQSVKMSYSSITGMQQVSKKIDMMDAYQFAAFAKDGHDNAWTDYRAGNSTSTADADRGTVENGLFWNQTPQDLYPYLNGEQGLTNTDWQDAIFRNALLTNQGVSFTGGTEGIRYYVSGNYANQKGVIINSDYKRYSARLNLDANHNRLSVGINFSPSYSLENRVDADDASGVVANALQMAPVFPVYNEDGSYNYDGFGKWRVGRDYQHNAILNPVAQANLKKNQINNANLLAKAYLGYTILDGLKYKISLAGTVNNYSNDRYTPTVYPSRWQDYPNFSNTNASSGYTSNTAIYNWILEHNLTYDKTFGLHHFKVLGGYSAQKNSLRSSNVSAVNYSNDLNQTVNAGQISDKGANIQEWSLVSWLGRVQYDFESKYLASISFRADGSSRFGENNKYGYFPAASVGWVVSKEEFMKSVGTISNLKLRASYGSTGNFQIGNYDHISSITEKNYILGTGNGSLQNGLALDGVANPDLGWEVSRSLDIGLEVGLFNQRLSLELDYYDRKTSNLLLNVPIPLTTGFTSARQNVGKVGNKGFEALLTTKNNFGALQWDANFNISVNRNKVLALGPENAPIIDYAGVNHNYAITQVGSPIGSYYLMKTNGVYLNAQDVAENPSFGNSRPGDFKFVDVDGDGKMDLNKDRTIIGNYFPNFTAGLVNSFSYRGIDLSFTFQTVQGVEIVNLLKRYIDNMEGNVNGMTTALNRWRSEDDPGNGMVNRANRKAKGNNGRTSDWHVEDGSFVRLQNVTLGYSLPKSLTDRINIGSARIFVSGQNLITWTKYSGYNPEVSLSSSSLTPGVDYGTYPLARTFSAGLNINF